MAIFCLGMRVKATLRVVSQWTIGGALTWRSSSRVFARHPKRSGVVWLLASLLQQDVLHGLALGIIPVLEASHVFLHEKLNK